MVGATTTWSLDGDGLVGTTTLPDGRTIEQSYVQPVQPGAVLSAIERPNITEREITPGPGAAGSPIPQNAEAGCQVDFGLNGSASKQTWTYGSYHPKTHRPNSVQGPNQQTSYVFDGDTGAFESSTQPVADAVLPAGNVLTTAAVLSPNGFVERWTEGPLARKYDPAEKPEFASDGARKFLVGQSITDPDGKKLTTAYDYECGKKPLLDKKGAVLQDAIT